ncbi:beta-N-acetylhexosaminidase [Thalassotalea fusca]
MGPVMIDVLGTSLTKEDEELIQHPLVGGLILFTRNYESPEQVAELSRQIRCAKKQDILIAVDHEGGRVQRFREHFSRIPAMGSLLSLTDSIEEAKRLAQICGQLMALEVQAVGVDISFAPVLDLNLVSDVIGDRGFSSEPNDVALLASAFIKGMHLQGMSATGKHFPGHGSVVADSHVAKPVDERSFDEIANLDMQPFKALIGNNLLDAIMPAHVIYPSVDEQSVGFSHYWLQKILRESLSFDGVIFSDDLSMEGAASIGGYVERCEAAQEAGCDMLLVCNNREASELVLDKANIYVDAKSAHRLNRMLSKEMVNWQEMKASAKWQNLNSQLNTYIT